MKPQHNICIRNTTVYYNILVKGPMSQIDLFCSIVVSDIQETSLTIYLLLQFAERIIYNSQQYRP